MRIEKKSLINENIQYKKQILESSSDYQNSEPNQEVNYFCNNFCSQKVKLSIQTLREEIKPVVSENFEFEYRDKTILLASFGISGLSKIRA